MALTINTAATTRRVDRKGWRRKEKKKEEYKKSGSEICCF